MSATYLFTLALLDENNCNGDAEFYINQKESGISLEIFADNGMVYEVTSLFIFK